MRRFWQLATVYFILLDTRLQCLEKNPFSRLSNENVKKTKSTLAPVEKKFIKISIILPQDALNIRSLRGCITRETNKINNGNWAFLNHFQLET
jgi:hypothetical protein